MFTSFDTLDIQKNIEDSEFLRKIEKIDNDETLKSTFKNLSFEQFEQITSFLQNTYCKISRFNNKYRAEITNTGLKGE